MPQKILASRLLAASSLGGNSRIAAQVLVASQSLAGNQRIIVQGLVAAQSIAGEQRVAGQQIVAAQGIAGNQKIHGQYLVVAKSIHNAFVPELLESGEIYGIEAWDVEYESPIVPEFNPYRPTIPEELIDLGQVYYDFYRENQEILRQQHNITQAGDTTFPWQLILYAHDEKIFNVGSIGRFYHDTYGVMLARYCKFDSMIPTTNYCVPVGLMKSKLELDWTVTNQISYSDPETVVGMVSIVDDIVDGQYGWVVVDGTNLGEITTSDSGKAHGDAFVWSANEAVHTDGSGRILGRRQGNQKISRLVPGTFKVQVESWSEDQIAAFASASVAAIQAQIDELSAALGGLDQAAILASISSIQTSIAALTARIALEEQRRLLKDNALQAQFNALSGSLVTQSDLDLLESQLSSSITVVNDTLTLQINQALALANQALAQIAALSIPDLTSLNAQIAALWAAVNGLTAELESRPYGILPVVDGSVPPNLVYLDDGSLVWVEVY